MVKQACRKPWVSSGKLLQIEIRSKLLELDLN